MAARFGVKTSVVAVFLCLSAVAHAQHRQIVETKRPIPVIPGQLADGKSVNAEDLDVAGIKLGMTVEEAKAAMAKYFAVSPKAIHESFLDYSLWTARPVKKHVFKLNYFDETHGSISVDFQPVVPFTKDMSVTVSGVSYEIPRAKANKESAERLRSAAFEKYGTPSVWSNQSASPQWCSGAWLIQSGYWECPSLEPRLLVAGFVVRLENQHREVEGKEYSDKTNVATPKL